MQYNVLLPCLPINPTEEEVPEISLFPKRSIAPPLHDFRVWVETKLTVTSLWPHSNQLENTDFIQESLESTDSTK